MEGTDRYSLPQIVEKCRLCKSEWHPHECAVFIHSHTILRDKRSGEVIPPGKLNLR